MVDVAGDLNQQFSVMAHNNKIQDNNNFSSHKMGKKCNDEEESLTLNGIRSHKKHKENYNTSVNKDDLLSKNDCGIQQSERTTRRHRTGEKREDGGNDGDGKEGHGREYSGARRRDVGGSKERNIR